MNTNHMPRDKKLLSEIQERGIALTTGKRNDPEDIARLDAAAVVKIENTPDRVEALLSMGWTANDNDQYGQALESESPEIARFAVGLQGAELAGAYGGGTAEAGREDHDAFVREIGAMKVEAFDSDQNIRSA